MFKNHPKGLLVLAITNMGERFGYYTMLAILTLYMQAKFGLTSATTSMIYGSFLALVYFLPIFGGILADKALGYGKTILLGISIMFIGYFLMAIPLESNTIGLVMMIIALVLISIGTGCFKGNLQALVGKLYDDPQYSKNRDIAFSIFYMFINIGAFFAPSAASYINNAVLKSSNFTYDASIPKNYVALNDEKQAVDKSAFLLANLSPAEQNLTGKDLEAVVNKVKKEKKVIFTEDIENALFKLKAAGLYQYTQSKKITDPAQMISSHEYELLQSRDPKEKAEKDSVIAKTRFIQITDPQIGGGPNRDDFARNFGEKYVKQSLSTSYNLAFGVACISLIISVLIFLLFKKTWKTVDKTVKQEIKESKETGKEVKMMPKEEVRARMMALFLVFFVVIFFWMSFHQNGLTLTFFARDYTMSNIPAGWSIIFNLFPLLMLIMFLYGIYLSTIGLLGSKSNKKIGILLVILGIVGLAGFYYANIYGLSEKIKITPQIFQQFNPMFIIILTPLTVALFSYLANKGKEPSAPRKIGIGMFLAALGYAIMLFCSMGLPAPSDISGVSDTLVSPSWLISTYFVLTIAELFLSPMGLSFVSKVAPPQYSGLMQGGWLAATAIGNLLVGVIGTFWEKLPLIGFWSILIICCVLSGIFIFSIMKKLESATK